MPYIWHDVQHSFSKQLNYEVCIEFFLFLAFSSDILTPWHQKLNWPFCHLPHAIYSKHSENSKTFENFQSFFKFWLFLFKPWVWICLKKILLPNFWNDRFFSKPAAFFGKKGMICVYSCKFYTHQTAPITVRQSLVSLLHSVIFETCMKQKGAHAVVVMGLTHI